MSRNSENTILVFSVAIFCLILYFNSLWNVFILDDLHGIPENLYIKHIKYIPMFFKGYYTSMHDVPKGMLRPVLMSSFALNYLSSGLNPLGYHIINMLLHFLNGIMLFSLLRFFKKDIAFGLALSLCLIFTTHPINTEAVTYISCRSDLLATFFVGLSFLSFVKGRRMQALSLYTLALLSKETALVLLPLVFIYSFIYPSLYTRQKNTGKRMYIFYFTLILLTVLYWAYRGAVFHSGVKSIISAPLTSAVRGFWPNVFLQSVVAVFYLRLFFWPYPLNLHHIFPDYNSIFSSPVFFSLLIIGAAIMLIFALRKKQPLVSFGIAWYLICLLPKFYAVLNFPSMEHHFYMPSIGIYLILAQTVERLYLNNRRYFINVAAGILSIFIVLVWFRNYEWKDSLTLYKTAVKRDPASAVAHNNLGIEYSKIGLTEAAESEYKKALSLSNSADVQVNCRINLAHIYANKQRFKEALEELNNALKIKSRYSLIYQAYGVIYNQMNEKDKAEEIWKKGLTFNPKASGLLDNLGIMCLEKEKIKEARGYFEAAIKFKPDDPLAYFGLGRVLETESDIESAIKAYEKAVRLNPSHSSSHYSLGLLYAKRLDRRALWHFKEAVRLNPRFAEAEYNLAVFYASCEPPQLALSRQHAQKALSLGYAADKEFLKIIGYVQNGQSQIKGEKK